MTTWHNYYCRAKTTSSYLIRSSQFGYVFQLNHQTNGPLGWTVHYQNLIDIIVLRMILWGPNSANTSHRSLLTQLGKFCLF